MSLKLSLFFCRINSHANYPPYGPFQKGPILDRGEGGIQNTSLVHSINSTVKLYGDCLKEFFRSPKVGTIFERRRYFSLTGWGGGPIIPIAGGRGVSLPQRWCREQSERDGLTLEVGVGEEVVSLLIDAEAAESRLEAAEPLYKRMGSGNRRDRGSYVSGRSKHSSEAPEFVRELIAGEAKANGNVSATAKEWGVGHTAAWSYKNGKTSPNGDTLLSRAEKSHDLAAALEGDTAMLLAEKLLSAVSAVHVKEDDGALKNSVIARNLAGTLEKIRPKKEGNGNSNVINFNVFTPAKIDLASLGEPVTVIETTAKNVSSKR